MNTEAQLGSTPEELVENLTKSETRFPAYMALHELGLTLARPSILASATAIGRSGNGVR